MANNFSEKVTEQFRNLVTSTYDLEDSIVDQLCTFVSDAITRVGVPSGRGRARKQTTTRRKKSGYNVFVRTMMSQDEEIKKLNHKEKMAAIGARWKDLDADGKGEYNDLARKENESDGGVSTVEENETA